MPSNEPSFFPSMASQGPSQHSMGARGLDSTGAGPVISLEGLIAASQASQGAPMSAAQAYAAMGPDPSSIPQPGMAHLHMPETLNT